MASHHPLSHPGLVKILLVSDLHYTLRQWDWLTQSADRFDLVVVAGDLLDIGSLVPLEAQIVVVRKYLQRLAGKGPLLVASGNHDIVAPASGEERRADWLREYQDTRLWVDGDGLQHADCYFSVLPWWDGPETRRATETQLAEHKSLAHRKRWIWIYHPPPRNSTVAWSGRADLGDHVLTEWIDRYQPEMILGGHIHHAPFVPQGSWIDRIDHTWVFNSGQQPGGIPTFITLDLAENLATWIAAGQAEQAHLVDPLQRKPLE